ncbi:MAG: pimeloyl-ACP methyl ester esterase BioH [Rudaea sp.]|uniref:pimeloyl-ACP methyl ester esterase BioH n=1 Tax=unclassified Rudaea TaxID=2627037 RepID=UPI0014857148|nr:MULTISPECIES: pimeloyl-ACP methyl ester esterase BioH [unclassified Rudaea]MBN8885419.1 pimeloyl-ACP methyl ester esterase BioH [Rudaea sp.]MBR0346348.1 pimeloyl-ACP methyl ester esterase BioH [Rudaea sp.]
MHIETVGAGPDLVLIHGWAMHGGIFAPLTPLLAERFRVHLVDLPGHGFSRDDAAVVDARDWAARIAAATPQRALWVGWSMGGLVALHAALDAPEHVRGLVEIAESPRLLSAPDWPHAVAPNVLTEFGTGLQRDYCRAIERFLALELIGSANAQSMLRDLKARVFERGEPPMRVLVDGLRVLETSDLRARIAELRMPSLWIAGRRDRLISSEAMRWSSQQSAGGEFVEIDSGHAPFLSHPQEVAEAIFDFADRLPALTVPDSNQPGSTDSTLPHEAHESRAPARA